MPELGGWSRREFLERAGGAAGALGAGAALLAALDACGTSASGSTTPAPGVTVPGPAEAAGTLEVWGFNGNDPLDVTAKSRLDAFRSKFHNVTVQLSPGAVDPQRFLSASAADSPPDLLYAGRPQITSLADMGSLLALEPYVDASGLDLSQFRRTAVTEVTLNGYLYAIPEFTNVVVAFVNNRLLRSAGLSVSDVDFSDWEGMAGLNRRLTRVAGGHLQRVGFDPRLPELTPLWAAANGGGILTADGKRAVMEGRRTVEAVRYGASLRQAVGGQQMYAGFCQGWEPLGARNMIVEEQVAIVLFEQFLLTQMGKLTPAADFTVLPVTTHKEGKPITFMSGNAWAVPIGSKQPGLAVAMARFMTDPDTWVLSARANAATFAPPSVYAGTYTANRIADRRIMTEVYRPSGKKSFDEAVRVILDVADHAVTLPPSNAGKRVMEAMTKGVNAALLDPQDPESAMRSAAQEAQLALGPPPPDYGPDWPPGVAQRSSPGGIRRGIFDAQRR